MSTPTPEATPAPSRRRRKKEDKKSLWQMDLSSIGKKDAEPDDEAVDHAPFVPTLPRVNLLPVSVRDGIAVRRARRGTVLAILAIVIVSGALWWLQGSRITAAESDLAAAQAENAQLQKNLTDLAPVKQMYDEITRLQGIVTTTMASQPQAAVVVDRIAQAGGDAITFANIEVAYHGIPQPGAVLNPCPNPNPFGSDVTIGCVNFTATTNSLEEETAFLRALEDDSLFVGPYITSSSVTSVEGEKKEQIALAGSAGVSLEGLKTLLTDEQIAAIITPPAPAPAPSASAEAGAS